MCHNCDGCDGDLSPRPIMGQTKHASDTQRLEAIKLSKRQWYYRCLRSLCALSLFLLPQRNRKQLLAKMQTRYYNDKFFDVVTTKTTPEDRRRSSKLLEQSKYVHHYHVSVSLISICHSVRRMLLRLCYSRFDESSEG
jgi:hypothetical protein